MSATQYYQLFLSHADKFVDVIVTRNFFSLHSDFFFGTSCLYNYPHKKYFAHKGAFRSRHFLSRERHFKLNNIYFIYVTLNFHLQHK